MHHDPDHFIGEYREIIVGYSTSGRLLLVSFTERGQSLRIIHVRRVDAAERHAHEEST
ncbi:MAG TPA: BrnT family toxin [Thermoanaerobaculia bacterium]|nr:BrnT family toxin [Thermoanaerobaculia bacterium]